MLQVSLIELTVVLNFLILYNTKNQPNYEYFINSFCTENTLHLNYPLMLYTEIITPVPRSIKYHTNILWAVCRTF